MSPASPHLRDCSWVHHPGGPAVSAQGRPSPPHCHLCPSIIQETVCLCSLCCSRTATISSRQELRSPLVACSVCSTTSCHFSISLAPTATPPKPACVHGAPFPGSPFPQPNPVQRPRANSVTQLWGFLC